MPSDQRQSSLPTSDAFWASVDNDPTRQFYNTFLIEKIRNSSPSSDEQRVAFIAELKLLVELLDSPAEVAKRNAMIAIEAQDRAELESVL